MRKLDPANELKRESLLPSDISSSTLALALATRDYRIDATDLVRPSCQAYYYLNLAESKCKQAAPEFVNMLFPLSLMKMINT